METPPRPTVKDHPSLYCSSVSQWYWPH